MSLDKLGFEIIKDGKTGIAKARFNASVPGVKTDKGQFSFELSDEEKEGVNPEEFLLMKARMLSKTITQSRFFDFTIDGVLKKAVPMFDKLTVYSGHYVDVDNWKGFTSNPVWDSKNDPEGVNVLVTLDRTNDPKICRGFDIGALRSFSVTICFKYEKSHPNLGYYYDHLGTTIDGETVRYIVTEILSVNEVSVVWEGEDPYAKKLQKQFHKQEGKEEMLLTIEDGLKEKLGLSKNEISQEELQSAVSEKFSAMAAELESLKVEAGIGKKYLEDTKEAALAAYKAAKGEQFHQGFADNVIGKADIDTALSLLDEYREKLESDMPLTCPKCGEQLTRQSSVTEDDKKSSAKPEDIRDFKV